jgi:hypothetical protein
MWKYSALGLSMVSMCVVGCGGDDSDDSSPQSSSSSSLSAAELAAGGCNEEMGMQDSDCDAYVECATNHCQAEYQQCLGEDYESGDFSSGTCESFISCSLDADDPCENSCSPDQACISCFITLGQCVSAACSAELQECGGGSASQTQPSGAGSVEFGDATCEDLKACCDSLSGTDQADCNQQYMALATAGDIGCAASLSIYQAAQLCQ